MGRCACNNNNNNNNNAQVLAWGLLLPTGACSAHFCRQMGQEGWWFQLHRALQCSGLLVATAGFATVVAAVSERGGAHFSKPHHQIGLAVMVLGWMQVPTSRTTVTEDSEQPSPLFVVLIGVAAAALGSRPCGRSP